MTLREYVMMKVATRQISSTVGFVKRAEDHPKTEKAIQKQELKVLKQEIKNIKPKSEKEKHLEQLIGRKWTKGQYTRGAAIGAGVGLIGHVAGTAIEGSKLLPQGITMKQVMLNPRKLTRAAAIASLYGAAIPAVRHIADAESAKRGKF